MAWEISITAEGWSEIYDKVHTMEPKDLIAAIVDDEIEGSSLISPVDMEAYMAKRQPELEGLTQDVLADLAFALIEQNNTCDNGGWAYWIDREGYHKVYLD